MRNKITASIIRIYIPFFILLFLIPVCSKQIIKDEPEAKTLNQEETSRLIKIITDINNNAPDSFSLKINIDGIINNKILKSSGEAVYNDTPRLMKINFVDNLFGSTLATIIQHGETVKLYFPVEKTLYMDNINTINLRNYADINIDYYIIAGLSSGRIPLLKHYHIKNAFEKDENGRLNENDIYIILENNLYYETIAFKGDFP
ncbi:MAG: hypothetical protein MUC95_04065, partial [Spirochaetes bacterium]|nr:hypothetical protein [Spirochaetota bacterium]